MKNENNNPLSAIPFRNLKFIIRHWMIALSLALLAACTSDSGNSWNAENVCPERLRGYFTDHRDGREYKYTTIGDQVWMAENLEYNAENSSCYDNDLANCEIYGRLYRFSDASEFETICPEGWHLPAQAEWDELIEVMGGKKNISKGVLRAREGWFTSGANGTLVPDTSGTNVCGFSALPGGMTGKLNEYHFFKTSAEWWTSTRVTAIGVITYTLIDEYGYYGSGYISGWSAYSIRCVKDK